MLNDDFCFFVIDGGPILILHAHHSFGPFSLIFFLTGSFFYTMACAALLLEKRFDISGLPWLLLGIADRYNRENKEGDPYDTNYQPLHEFYLRSVKFS